MKDNRSYLINRIINASDFKKYHYNTWLIAQEDISNNYPQCNSRTRYEIECPVCHIRYEVMLKNLYRQSNHCCISCNRLEVSTSGVLHTPDARSKAINNTDRTKQDFHELGRLSIISRFPDHDSLVKNSILMNEAKRLKNLSNNSEK